MKTHLLSLIHVKLATRWEETFVFSVADFHFCLYKGLVGRLQHLRNFVGRQRN